MSTTTSPELTCTVLTAADPAFATEIAAFNLAVTHAPARVVCATNTEDIAAAVRQARAQGLRVSVQGAGHGAYVPFTDGVLISTRRMQHVSVDPERRLATIGAGVAWSAVVEAAALHGLFPITGSSPNVGVVGYLLGGGLGPLARSHGFSSDYLEGAVVVTGAGEVLDTDDHPELLWALRGGKYTGCIVAEVRFRLVEQRSLYGGSLFFDTPHIEQAFRFWTDWTAHAPEGMSTSVGIMRFPPLEVVPAPFRGKRLMVLHVTHPGPVAEAERLAQPLRAMAPVYFDDLMERPCTEVGRIHNDPTQPNHVWISGLLLDRIDQDFATAYLDELERAPFGGVEIRHLGGATRKDVPEGSAVGGRGASFTVGYASVDRTLFAELPAASDRLLQALAPWTSAENNVNFMGRARSAEHHASAWPDATYARLKELRKRFDPDAVIHLPTY